MIRILLIILICFTTSSAQAPNSLKFNLGIIIPLSGDLAEYGTAIKNGFELARKQNQEKFKELAFIYEDSRYDGKTAVDALQKLVSTNSIDLYYLWGVSPTESMLPIADRKGLPVIAETTIKEATVGKPLVIRAARTGERIAQALSNEIKKREIKSVSLVVTQIPFYLDIVKHLAVFLKASGIELNYSFEVLPSQSSLKSFLLDKKLNQSDSVGVFLLPSQFITFFREANQAKLDLKVFSADIIDSESIVKDCPDNVNGTFYTQVGVTSEFREKYKEEYGDDIQIGSAAQSYDLAVLLQELFSAKDHGKPPAEIISRITKMAPHAGATGEFSYSESIDSGKEIQMPISMKVIKNKKLEILD